MKFGISYWDWFTEVGCARTPITGMVLDMTRIVGYRDGSGDWASHINVGVYCPGISGYALSNFEP